MKYSSQYQKLNKPKKPFRFSKRKVTIFLVTGFAPILLLWVIFYSDVLKVQATTYILPVDFKCLSQAELNKYDQTGKSIFFFNTQLLEAEIKKNTCIEDVFVELSPDRSITISMTNSRQIANFFLGPQLNDVKKIASSTADLRSATVSALLQSSSLIDTLKDLNSRSLIQPRTASRSALPKFIVPEAFKQQSDYSSYKINNVLDCLNSNLIQVASVVLVNDELLIYYINVNNGFTTLDAKLLTSPNSVTEKFCPVLQEIIQKSTIDGIKLDSIDLRFKDPVVNIKK